MDMQKSTFTATSLQNQQKLNSSALLLHLLSCSFLKSITPNFVKNDTLTVSVQLLLSNTDTFKMNNTDDYTDGMMSGPAA